LNRILLILLTSLISTNIWSAQVGVVDSLRAIIYADLERESPIGYVRKGKQLMLGNVKRRSGTMLPVMVNGQVAWIKVTDIYLPEENKSFDDPRLITEHEVLMDNDVKDPLDQNNFLTVKLSPSSLSVAGSVSSSDGSEEELSEDMQSATELDFLYEHKNPYHALHWGVGLSYFTGEIDSLSMKSVFLKGGMTWVPVRTSFLNVEFYTNLTLSGDFRIESQGIGEYKANMVGLDYGALVRFFPESKLGFFAGLGGSYYRFSNLSSIVLAGETQSVDLSSLSGTKVQAGIAYKF